MSETTSPPPHIPSPLIAAVFAVLVVIWGSTWLAIKVGLEYFPPLFAVAVRFCVAGPTFLLVMKLRRIPIPWQPRHQPFFLLLGVLSFVLSFGTVYWAEQYITSGLAAVIFSCLPLLTALVSLWLLKSERLTRTRLLGIALGLAGMFVIHSGDLRQMHPKAPLAAVLILVSPTATAFSTILTKRKIKEYSILALAGFPMLYGGLIDLGLYALLQRDAPHRWGWPGAASIAYLTVFGSLITFTGYNWLLKHIEVGRANLIAYLTPIFALLLGYFLGDEPVTGMILLGAAMVLAGTATAGTGLAFARPRSTGASGRR